MYWRESARKYGRSKSERKQHADKSQAIAFENTGETRAAPVRYRPSGLRTPAQLSRTC